MSDGIRVWVDGSLVDASQPAISALDHGVTVGDGVFETLKVVDGVPFALHRHHARLRRSCAGLGLAEPDLAVVNAGITAVLGVSRLDFGRLRYTITGGVGPLGSDRLSTPLTYVVTAGPQPCPPRSVSVVVAPWTRNERSATVGLKTTSYAENVVALAYAHEHGAAEALMANTRGELCEGTGSNVFVVVDGEVRTPPTSSGLLAGVTRELVIEWGRAAGVDIVEADLPMDVLDHADEVFITSSTRDVMPVHAVGSRELAIGPVTTRLREIFAMGEAGEKDP